MTDATRADVEAIKAAVTAGLHKCRHEDAPAPLIREADVDHIAHMVTTALLASGVVVPASRVEEARAEVRKALHDAWLAVHLRRFDGDYRGDVVPEFAEQITPDTIYNGTIRAEAAITAVARSHGIDYHALRDLRVPLASTATDTPEGGA